MNGKVLVWVSGALVLVTLGIDAVTPLGVADPVLYLLPVVLGLWTPHPAHAMRVAAAAAVLTTVGYWASPPGGDATLGIVNRLLALLAVGATAVGVTHTRRLADALQAAEARLRDTAALARLGEMAAVVAHEVKNPLTGIGGALQIIGERLPADSRDRKIVADIRTRIASLNDSVQDLLLYARPRAPNRTRINTQAILRETATLARQDTAMVDLEVVVTGENPVLDADPNMMREVFLNLVLNAGQAMGGRGQVVVTVRRRAGACEVTVADAGPGIPEDIRAKVFEPFFTTRSRGTGLGLAIVRRTVEVHGGDVSVACPAEGGTRVTVRLPSVA